MMDEEPDGANMVLHLLREGEGLADQATDALSHRAVGGLNSIRLTRVLTHRTMAF